MYLNKYWKLCVFHSSNDVAVCSHDDVNADSIAAPEEVETPQKDAGTSLKADENDPDALKPDAGTALRPLSFTLFVDSHSLHIVKLWSTYGAGTNISDGEDTPNEPEKPGTCEGIFAIHVIRHTVLFSCIRCVFCAGSEEETPRNSDVQHQSEDKGTLTMLMNSGRHILIKWFCRWHADVKRQRRSPGRSTGTGWYFESKSTGRYVAQFAISLYIRFFVGSHHPPMSTRFVRRC